ncbi:phage tail protein [Riemerella anatipestifer]|uniref:phage tail protein n=1 Tax=Riemerella anatipestifer TaxID=34085 RepID=UPI0021F875A7|nr:phage tail protein [Riemerella anatipestifer]MCW0509519.1 phage tail protein [Riemerella anatipestifer]
MKYNILRNNNVITMVRATGSLTEKLFGEETLTLDFTLPHFVLFRIGDAVEVYGKTYYISQEPVVNKKSTKEYVYNLVFNGGKYRLAEVQYFFYDENNELNISEFSITATAQKMVELLVANANRTQTGWSVGNIDSTETKTVDFSEYNCLAALTKISEEFGLEFWIDADKSIHLEERKKVSGYTLEYGKSKGLKGITRNPYTESSLVTRLYARGSSRNIPKNYRNGQKVLRMPVPFLEKNTDKYGVIEHTQPFEDIYPKRVGTVTQVYADNPLKFSDSTLDFDLNQYNEYGNTILQKGISAKIIFQTGDLAGYTLEVKEYGFDSVTKTFTLLKNQDEKSFDIPSDTFRPQVGDKYIIIDIAMPKSYVDNAEQELQAAAQDYLDKNSKQRFIYAVEPDPIYLKKINFNLKLGHTVRFKDTDFNLDDDIRVISITRNINNPYDISFEIAEQATITQIVRNYIEKEKAQTAIKKQQKYNAEMARRSFLFAEEIKNNVFDNEGYFDAQKIKPLSIETGMLSVGSRMQQFSLPNIALSITSDNKRLHNTAGQMVHLTIDPNAPRTWNLAENTTVQFSDNFNFIYIKADKIGSNATIVVTEQKILFDSDPIFYFFLAGNVSSIINGIRRIKTSYGYTQITPSEITTGRIASPNGNNYIDLLQDGIEINAKVTFASNSPAIQQAVDAVSVGGRNLVRESNIFLNGISADGISSNITSEGYLRVISSISNNNWHTRWYSRTDEIEEQMTEGEAFTITFWVKRLSGYGKPTIYLKDGMGYFYLKGELNNSEFKPLSYTGTWKKAKSLRPHLGWAPANGEFIIKCWKIEKGNKATDWTPAPEDVQAEINAVKAKADQLDNLGTMAWQNSVEKAMLGDTIIQGGYIKTELLNASAIVSNGGGATTSQLNSAISSIVVGGRNYLRGSQKGYGMFNNNGRTWDLTQGEENGVKWISGTSVNNGNFSISTYFHLLNNLSVFTENLTGQETIQSMEVKPTHDMYIGLWENNRKFCPANVWTKIENSPYNNTRFIGIYAIWNNDGSVPSTAKIYHRNWKLEKGNKATDWTPAPEDLDTLFANLQQGIANMQTSLSDVKSKTDNFASIQGGLMMANLMSVGSNQANQNAFISGITDEGAMSVRFGAGANYANKHNAPFRVLDNGKMIAQDADITGRVTATGGNIGEWEINGSSFRSSSIGSNDSWAQYSNYALFSPDMFLIRKNGSERGETKEVAMGITSSISAGSEGAAAAIKSNIKKTQYDFDRDNVALRLEAKNGVTNTALDILSGDIRVGGEVGYTGELFLGGVWLTIRKGIITNYS